MSDISTDAAWEEWGRHDPYFGVITNPKFRRAEITDQTRREFFESGTWHVNHILETVRRYVYPDFVPKSVLEFGCGVGRLLIPFAAIAREVVGLDVSPSMLHEARKNCDARHLENVRLQLSDDTLSSLAGTFDLIHSYIVFQHVPPERGREIVRRILEHIAPGGVGVLHFLHSKTRFSDNFGVGQTPTVNPGSVTKDLRSPSPDPDIQMNPYIVNEVLFLIQMRGVERFHAELTDHGGELGILIYFRANA